MEPLYIVNGLVYAGRRFQRLTLRAAEGRLTLLPPDAPTGDGALLDAAGLRVVPGFLDIHTHGGAGVDVNAADAAALGRLSAFFAAHGVTSFLMSVLTDTPERTARCIGQYRAYRAAPGPGAELLGVHLEGPFLSPAHKGAMPEPPPPPTPPTPCASSTSTSRPSGAPCWSGTRSPAS